MRKVTFLIDEAASLGALPILATILQVGRAYAVCLQLYYQSLGQLVAAWPNGGEKVVLGNTTHVYAGTNDYEDAEAISKRCGNYGAVLESGGTSVGSSASRSSSGEGSSGSSASGNRNWAINSTPLLRPEDVLVLPPRTAITFVPNTRPILTRLVPYYQSQNTGEASRAKCAALSVLLFLSAAVVAIAVTHLAKETSTWPKPSKPRQTTGPTPTSSRKGPRASSGSSWPGSTPSAKAPPGRSGDSSTKSRGTSTTGPRTRGRRN